MHGIKPVTYSLTAVATRGISTPSINEMLQNFPQNLGRNTKRNLSLISPRDTIVLQREKDCCCEVDVLIYSKKLLLLFMTSDKIKIFFI